jgi:hypothetical protein
LEVVGNVKETLNEMRIRHHNKNNSISTIQNFEKTIS